MSVRRPLVITGPTGWIGQALLMRLAAQRGAGWSAGVRLFGSRAGTLTAADGTALPVRPLDTLGGDDVAGADVVHLAYLTKEKAELLGERGFTDTNLAIDDHLLAAITAAPPAALFVASSGAAALAARGSDRHPYGLCKLRQEDRLLAWGARAGVPVLAGRIWNIAGPYMNKTGSYALGDMLTQARRDGTIRIAATVPVFRSYLHVGDLADLVLAALPAGAGAPAPRDLCGAEVLEMGDLAERVARYVGLGGDAIIRAPVDTARSSVYLGQFADTKALAMRLGMPLVDFARQLADTALWLEKHD
ncbi:NAD-dependent epimerase/dehydratase family protein [Sphingomonas sp. DT-51]|uniref:NAD-dependent epimerase/dehydratase family protein n=1 Tax=Sphingomonas sp. DT-51 TaxID=3396165 RepID=UPI003F1D23CB